MFGDDARRHKGLPRLFAALLKESIPFGEVYTTEALDGAAIWNPPGTFPLGWRTNTKMGFLMARLIRARIAVCAQGLLFFDRHHPAEPHWYLQMLGTDPQLQGKGIGSSLIRPILDRCDREGARAYLEASKEENVPFYARFGFFITEEMKVPRGPTVWAMWRDPH